MQLDWRKHTDAVAAFLEKTAQPLALGLMAFPAIAYTLACIGFHLGYALSPLTGCVAFVLSFVVTYVAQNRPEALTKTLLVLLGCFVLSLWVALAFYDMSYDGPQYHQEAIIQLAYGYNPFKEVIVPDRWDVSWSIWLNSLPKFTWVVQSVIYLMTGALEAAKAHTLLGMLAVFFYAFSVLHRTFGVNCRLATGLAFLLAANPITLTQYLSDYADGFAHVWTTLAALALAVYLKTWRRRDLWFALAIVSLAAITKVTSQIVILPAMGIFIAYVAWRRGFKVAACDSAALGVAGVLALLILAWNPYVTNMVRYVNPLFPMRTEKMFAFEDWGFANRLNGSRALYELIYSSNAPPNIRNESRVVRLLASFYSKVQNTGGENEPTTWRVPGVILSVKELKPFGTTDVRIAGWGPWFSLALTMAAALMLWRWRDNRSLAKGIAALWAFVLFTILVHPEGWWARYAAQAWWLPASAMLMLPSLQSARARKLAHGLMVVMLVNVGLIFAFNLGANLKNTHYFEKLARSYQEKMRTDTEKYIVTDLGNWWAHRVRYRDLGVSIVPTRLEQAFTRDQLMPLLSAPEQDLLLRSYEPERPTDRQQLAPPLSWKGYYPEIASGYIFNGVYLRLREGVGKEDLASIAKVFDHLAWQPFYQKQPIFKR